MSCGSRGTSPAEASAQEPVSPSIELLASITPSSDARFKQGDKIEIGYTPLDGATIDSAVLWIDGQRIGSMTDGRYQLSTSEGDKVGRRIFRVDAYSAGDKHVKVGQFTLFPAASPRQYTYNIIESYPHDKNAYTQGLFYHNGFLYESTGQTGQSTMRKVELKSGKVLDRQNLDPKYFGEGAVLLDGKIYQLTWTHNLGIVYDLESLKPISQFGYPTEGWGIATDGKSLYISDGTEKITIYSPDTFQKIGEISVYTDTGKIGLINELEWVANELWANVYTEDYIVRIDPATGAVVGTIDCRGLLSEADRTPTTDVLNGIAYNPADGAIYLTGKNWSRMFKVVIK